MAKHAASAWQWLVNWFERGDLVPLLVLVSSVHYASVLAGHDTWPVAVAIGLLVDLGHFRTVKAAVRYKTPDGKWINWQAVTRYAVALVMTALSLNYHQRYYADWWLSAPLPLLIAALAWLQRVDGTGTTKPATKEEKAERVTTPLAPVSEPLPVVSQPLERRYVCATCGYDAKNQYALAGHGRKHRKKEY